MWGKRQRPEGTQAQGWLSNTHCSIAEAPGPGPVTELRSVCQDARAGQEGSWAQAWRGWRRKHRTPESLLLTALKITHTKKTAVR